MSNATKPEHIEPRLVSVRDAQHMLSLGRTSIHYLIKTGKLDVVRIGAKTLIPTESVDRFAAEARETSRQGGRISIEKIATK